MSRLQAVHHPASLILLLLCVALGFFTQIPTAWPPVGWGRLPLVIRDYAPWGALAASLWGAVTGGRHRVESLVPGRAAGRSAPSLVTGELLPLAGAVWAGTLLGVAPYVVHLVRGAPGAPTFGDLLGAGFGVVLMATWVPLGYLLGLLWGCWAMVLAPVGVLLLIFVPAQVQGTPLASVSPWWGNSFPSPGWSLSWPAVLSRFTILSLGTASLLMWSMWLLSTPRRSRLMPREAVLLGGVTVAAGALSIVLRPTLVIPHGEAECQQVGRTSICSAPEEADLVKQWGPQVDSILQVAGVSGATVSTPGASRNVTADIVLRTGAGVDEQAYVDQTRRELAYSMSGASQCADPNGSSSTAVDLASDLAASLESIGRGGSATGAFRGVGRSELSEWFAQNRTAVERCTLKASDIP